MKDRNPPRGKFPYTRLSPLFTPRPLHLGIGKSSQDSNIAPSFSVMLAARTAHQPACRTAPGEGFRGFTLLSNMMWRPSGAYLWRGTTAAFVNAVVPWPRMRLPGSHAETRLSSRSLVLNSLSLSTATATSRDHVDSPRTYKTGAVEIHRSGVRTAT